MASRYIPTERELEDRVKLVEVMVSGDYIARIDERRKTSRRYEIKVQVPEKFTKSDLKRATPKALLESTEHADFISMRTFEQKGPQKKTDKTVKRRELYSMREVNRFKKIWADIAKAKKEELTARRGGAGMAIDTTEYGSRGLPPVINEPGEEIEG